MARRSGEPGSGGVLGLEPTHYATTVNDPGLRLRMLPTLSQVVHGNIRKSAKVTACEDSSEYHKRAPRFYFIAGPTALAFDCR